jgi:general transcription factor 3C polypeptide 5 (transcription factor C subunit 1)
MFRRSHLFDGQTVTKETAAFQLCDITDPMLKEMIEDPDDLREECNVS